MNSTSVLFYVFATVLLVAAFCVITARSTVHAALYLVLSFFSASCLWMLLRAEFLAITLVLVYVGAVMVLFLFVVMMLDINTDSLRQGFWKHLPLAGAVGAVIALEMALVLMRGFKVQEPAAVVGGVVGTGAGGKLVDVGNTKLLGIELYTNYLYPVQLAAVLLLVAIIAAIALTLRARKDSRHMDPSQQVRAKKADRMRLVKMNAVIEAPSLPKVLDQPAALAAATTTPAAPTAPTAPATASTTAPTAPKPAGGAA
jgi:NADH-quinone oxidoreductase subunit J